MTMMSINGWDLGVMRGDIVPVMTPEGMSDDFVCYIQLSRSIDECFQLKHEFRGKIVETASDDYEFDDGIYYINAYNVAVEFMEKIRARGAVNMAHWEEVGGF